MSMNLHCDEVNLWQTPTHITWMCYSNRDGGWKGIRYRYCEWVKGTLNGVYKTTEEADDARYRVSTHLALINSKKTLTFSVV
jgi:hypothetical protein